MLQTDAQMPAGSPTPGETTNPLHNPDNAMIGGFFSGCECYACAQARLRPEFRDPPKPPTRRTAFTVLNWTLAYELEVSACAPHGEIPALVGVFARGGNLDLHHCMTALQARQMAAQLMLCADAIEARSCADVAEDLE